jgi:hypothetical protein
LPVSVALWRAKWSVSYIKLSTSIFVNVATAQNCSLANTVIYALAPPLMLAVTQTDTIGHPNPSWIDS